MKRTTLWTLILLGGGCLGCSPVTSSTDGTQERADQIRREHNNAADAVRNADGKTITGSAQTRSAEQKADAIESAGERKADRVEETGSSSPSQLPAAPR